MTKMQTGTSRSDRRTLVVIGYGMVGYKLVQSLVERRATSGWDIVVVGEEPHRAYDRVHLSSLFEGTAAADLVLEDPAIQSDPAISVLLDDPVRSIDREARMVTTASGYAVAYDIAVLATGSVPFVPPVAGQDLPGCFVYRTISDVDAI